MWKNFTTLARARPDCLVSSSGAVYKTWSGAGQNCNVSVRSAASQWLASYKPAASQPLIRGWLATIWIQKVSSSNICKREILVSGRVIIVSKNLLLTYEFSKLVKKISFATYKLFCHRMLTSARSEPDQNFQASNLEFARAGPDQTIDCHKNFPRGLGSFVVLW